MRWLSAGLVLALGPVVTAPLFAQDAEIAGHARLATNVEQCWADWLAAEGLTQGINRQADGSFKLTAPGRGEVNAEKSDGSKWVAARDAAFTTAELDARNSLAAAIATEIQSSRSLDAFLAGGDAAPSVIQEAAAQLSIADKALALTGAALDNEIRKYKPEWDGTGRTEEQKRKEILKVETRVRERIASQARVFASGAFTAVQCEGPNSDGKYSVLAGMIWSPKLARISEAIVNPAFSPPPASPDAPLPQQFAERDRSNPDWMAVTAGARVWKNERGERVVIGFGTVPASSQASIDATRARTRAIAAIQRFAGEKVEGADRDNVDFVYRETDVGAKSFNANDYQLKIEAVAREMTLQGASEVKSWRGKHPWSGTPMMTVAVAWSPSNAESMRAASKALDAAAGPRFARPSGAREAPAGAPVRSGADARTADF